MTCARVSGLAAVSGLWLAVLACPAAGRVELAGRYIDTKNGFSLCPPMGAEQKREFSVSRLVGWQVRDARTGAISWTLTVRREGGPAGSDARGFAEAIRAAMEKAGECRVEGVEPVRLLDRQAFRVGAERGDTARRWHRETWVVLDPNTSLVVALAGPAGMKDALDAASAAIVDTLRLFDVGRADAERKESLDRGRSLLAALTPQRLAAAIPPEPQWFIYRRGGEELGYLCTTVKAARREGASGLEVRSLARLNVPGGQVMYVRRELFASADRGRERWTETLSMYAKGRLVKKVSESGWQEPGAVVCKVSAEKTRTLRKPLPPAMAAVYLPRALTFLLPRLVKLDAPGAYGFATYTTAANDFDLCTFAVRGRKETTIGSRTVQAIVAADQLAADKAPATLYLDDDGALLRMETPEGVIMEQASLAAVLRRWSDAGGKAAGDR